MLVVLLALAFFLFPFSTQSTPLQRLNPANAMPLLETQVLELKDGQKVELSAGTVEHSLNGQKFYGYAYNQQFPGPVWKVQKGASLRVHFTNDLDVSTTVHWHGLRLKNEFDGVPMVTQPEVQPGQSFDYELVFPDEGLFWYHPHVREDVQQERGLYGTILVESQETQALPVQKEVLVLDDVLMESGELVPFENRANFALMGRYGNVMLVNGKAEYALRAVQGERVRLHVLNASNARPFSLAIPNTQFKVLGSDAGFYAQPFFADHLVLGPSERAIVEVLFEEAGEYKLFNSTPVTQYTLGTIRVASSATPMEGLMESFSSLSANIISMQEYASLQAFTNSPYDFEYELTLDWKPMSGMHGPAMMNSMHSFEDGIEWEDAMAYMNGFTTSDDVTWIIRDPLTKKQNMDLTRTVKKGELKKIRFKNLDDSPHPMNHVIHVHGNRFVVLSVDGKPNERLVWKDSALIPAGATMDVLVEFSNPGTWMVHCHNAEHLESGMMTQILVAE